MRQSVSNIVQLLALETALPDYVLEQRVVAQSAAELFSGRDKDYGRISTVFETAGIRTRYSTQPIAWFMEPHGWADRSAAYLEGARHLFIQVAQKALLAAGLEAQDIDTVVTVSTTGLATPSIEAHAFRDLGLQPHVRRVPVFGLGCGGGAAGLGIASSLAAARPGRPVLLVVVELCTRAFGTC